MKRLILLTIVFSVVTSISAQFSSESEASMVISGGNSKLEVYNLKTINKYSWDKNAVKASGHYTYGTSANIESARNWDGALRYDRTLTERVNAFFAHQIEGDSFNGIQSRNNTDLGGKYFFIKNDTTELLSEAGMRYTIEDPKGLPTRNDTRARLYSEGNRKQSEDLSFKMFAEYIPNFSRSEDWLFNYGPSLNFRMSNIFSLSLNYLARYDNQPVPGNRKTDYQYSTGLIAKF